MKDKERLTIKRGVAETVFLKDRSYYYDGFRDCKTLEACYTAIKKLSDYENTNLSPAEIIALQAENAKLTEQLQTAVVLPCKVGDTVYFNTYKNNATECIGVQPHKVESICVGYYVGNHTAIYDYDFGNSVFLTKPEAEVKLKELEEQNDNN